MSTRCNIIIKDRWNRRVILYHHFDGYPEGVGADLKKYLSKWESWQIRSHGMRYIANELVKNTAGLNDDGYEITAGIHGDIEYLYVINCKTGTLRCWAVPWDTGGFDRRTRLGNIILRRRNLREIPKNEG